MPRPEVLTKIQSAEEEADRIVALAEDDRDERIAEARDRAEEIRTEAEEKAREQKEKQLEEAREAIDAECEAILEEGRAARARLAEQSKRRVGEVTDDVVDLFTEEVNAQT